MITIRQPTPPIEGGFAVSLVAPAPVSVNALYVPIGKGRLVLSAEGREFKNEVGWIAREAMMRAGLEETARPVALQIEWSKPYSAGDLSNILKALEDALSGIVYADDRQIVEEHLWKDEDATAERGSDMVFVAIWEVG